MNLWVIFGIFFQNPKLIQKSEESLLSLYIKSFFIFGDKNRLIIES